ncbi:MAG: hypothetical protein NC299_12575 [Lachnospiraceae bacterium]|nr:hypothetical protein [Ruminococcus sp.]MCM1276175.1 hypothetical protein [Lachnospiraceae bacterium]
MEFKFLLVPIIVVVTGVIMLIMPTSTVFAFRTRTASKSPETQEYCNRLSGAILTAAGAAAEFAVLLTGRMSARIFGLSTGEFANALLAGVVLLSIPIVNFSCRKKFPELFKKE